MKTPLAWHNLVHERTRTLVAVAGVAFAVLLIFVQLGFFGGVQATASLIYDRLDFDIAVTSADYIDLVRAARFPRDRLARVRALPEVTAVRPLDIGLQQWLNPVSESRNRRGILVLGVDPADSPFVHPELTPDVVARLRQPDTVLMDRRTREEFGPQEEGTATDLGLLRVQIVGRFELGTGFGADGMVVVSESTFARAFGPTFGRVVSLGLVKLADGADAGRVADRLNELLPADVRAVPRDELLRQEQAHWVWDTSLGNIFFMGVVLAFVVGVVFVYQVMASDIAGRLGEYATLKAMGYGDRFIDGVVLQQAVLLALAGYVPGFVAADALYAATRTWAKLPVTMTAGVAGLVLALAVTMCTASGLLALRKLRAADPADLF
jgi:putative ABC transport system permease protein